jgi:phosphate:Na+ symporter
MIITIFGGIGIFLLGMVLLTEGLKTAAGDALRRILSRFTGGPVTAVVSGATAAALVQSSTATTVMTLGFVSAGLLPFIQAIGIVFGARIGTTSTGWLVSLLGLKLGIGTLALLFVGAGALLRLLGRGRASPLGLALAGLGLIFVGIDTLQSGMLALAERIDPAALPAGTGAGRFLLLGAGIAMSVLMQSSGAAIATTITAHAAGTIDLYQAAALVIGQNIGTIVTPILASIGASTAARRTALAHILFNATTAVVALASFPLAVGAAGALAGWIFPAGDSTAIAIFDTGTNLLGVLILLPFLGSFARLIERLIPERGPGLTRFLDASVTSVPSLAVDAARRTVMEVAGVLTGAARTTLREGPRERALPETLTAADRALADVRRFLADIRSNPESPREHARHLDVLHTIDHLESLIAALQKTRYLALLAPPGASRSLADEVQDRLAPIKDWLRDGAGSPPIEAAAALTADVAERRRTARLTLMDGTATGDLRPDDALEQMDALRWVDRIVYHICRATLRLAGATDNGSDGEQALVAEKAVELERAIDMEHATEEEDDDDHELPEPAEQLANQEGTSWRHSS